MHFSFLQNCKQLQLMIIKQKKTASKFEAVFIEVKD